MEDRGRRVGSQGGGEVVFLAPARWEKVREQTKTRLALVYRALRLTFGDRDGAKAEGRQSN